VLSTWFEILLGVGTPGFLLVAGALLSSWFILLRVIWRPRAKPDLTYRLAIEALCVLAVITVRSIFTPNLIWHFPAVFLLVVGYAEALRLAYYSRGGTKKIKENSYGYDRHQNRARQVAVARVTTADAPSGVL
jgi:O-antigen ligase